MNVKKQWLLLYAVGLFLSQSIAAHAKTPTISGTLTENHFISPQWINVNDINLNIGFENGGANCSGKIRALSGTTKIYATFKLERKEPSGWMHEKTWNKSSSTNTLSFFETYAVLSGYTYRLSVTADVTRNGVVETVDNSLESKY